ncbi:MAG: tail fiber domain-containing protein, partial [Candidatus Portnoybacteria bacterium]|nr:tail fiber domain-containing protein [Candidatus Portnoybacteria bacterium]
RLEVDGNIKLLYASGKGLLIGNETFSDANPIAGPWLFCDDNSGTAFQGSCGFRIGPSADVNDFFSFGYAPGQSAKIYARSITTTNPAETRSDVRLKKDIATINDVLRGLMSIRGASYTRTDAKGSEIDRRELGVIAQEVETAFPDLVHIDPVSGYKTVNYDGFVGVFIEAIKEQQAEIDDLQKQIDELKAQVEGLK